MVKHFHSNIDISSVNSSKMIVQKAAYNASKEPTFFAPFLKQMASTHGLLEPTTTPLRPVIL